MMSTRARKARKRAGKKFTKEPKVGTPPEQRSYVTALVRKPNGKMKPRSQKSVDRYLEGRTTGDR